MFFMHIRAHIQCSRLHIGETKDQSRFPLIFCDRRVEGGSVTVHRTHSRGEQCCLLASPVSALHPAPQTDYPDPLNRFVFVDVDC